MSKIFEALQYAHTERIQLDKLARQLSTEPRDNTQVLRPAPVPEVRTEGDDRTADKCDQQSHPLRRQGMWDTLLRLVGRYPWQCSQCHRHFYHSRPYIGLSPWQCSQCHSHFYRSRRY
jgi:hypothetical protein